MSERKIETVIGDEVSVTVFFDYWPKEDKTLVNPGADSFVYINAVCVDGIESKDIQIVLNKNVIEALKIECFESIE